MVRSWSKQRHTTCESASFIHVRLNVCWQFLKVWSAYARDEIIYLPKCSRKCWTVKTDDPIVATGVLVSWVSKQFCALPSLLGKFECRLKYIFGRIFFSSMLFNIISWSLLRLCSISDLSPHFWLKWFWKHFWLRLIAFHNAYFCKAVKLFSLHTHQLTKKPCWLF